MRPSDSSKGQPEGLEKLNSSDILSRFAERDIPAVVGLLDSIGHPEWVFEGNDADTQSLPQRAGRVDTVLEAIMRDHGTWSPPSTSKEAIEAALGKVAQPHNKIKMLLSRIDALLEERRQIAAERETERECQGRWETLASIEHALATQAEAAAQARAAQAHAEAQVRSLRKQLTERIAAKAELESEARSLIESCIAVLKRFDDIFAAKTELEAANHAIINSRSWRAMEPARRFATFIRQILHALRGGGGPTSYTR